MTVDELRKALEGVRGDMKIFIVAETPYGTEADDAISIKRGEIYGFDPAYGEDPTELMFMIS